MGIVIIYFIYSRFANHHHMVNIGSPICLIRLAHMLGHFPVKMDSYRSVEIIKSIEYQSHVGKH